MKNIIYLIIFLSLVFTSCKSTRNVNQNNKSILFGYDHNKYYYFDTYDIVVNTNNSMYDLWKAEGFRAYDINFELITTYSDISELCDLVNIKTHQLVITHSFQKKTNRILQLAKKIIMHTFIHINIILILAIKNQINLELLD